MKYLLIAFFSSVPFLPLKEPIRSTAAVKEFAASTVEAERQIGAPVITEQGVGVTGEYEYTDDVPVKLSISTGKDQRRYADQTRRLTRRLRVRR